MKEEGRVLATAGDRSSVINGVDLGMLTSERAQVLNASGIAPVEWRLGVVGESYNLITVVDRKAGAARPHYRRADVAQAAFPGPNNRVERSAGNGGVPTDVIAVVNAKSEAGRTTRECPDVLRARV